MLVFWNYCSFSSLHKSHSLSHNCLSQNHHDGRFSSVSDNSSDICLYIHCNTATMVHCKHGKLLKDISHTFIGASLPKCKYMLKTKQEKTGGADVLSQSEGSIIHAAVHILLVGLLTKNMWQWAAVNDASISWFYLQFALQKNLFNGSLKHRYHSGKWKCDTDHSCSSVQKWQNRQ